MTKILNIDALGSDQRVLQLNGVEYVVEEMSVQNFIDTTKSAEQIIGRPLSEQVDESVKLIQRSIPTLPESELRRMPLRHLNAIIAFVRGEDPVVEEGKSAEEGKAKGTAGRKSPK